MGTVKQKDHSTIHQNVSEPIVGPNIYISIQIYIVLWLENKHDA